MRKMTLVVFFLALLVGLSLLYVFIPEKWGVCDYDSEEYVGRSREVCSTVTAQCVPGYAWFENDCGCGCRRVDVVEGGTSCGAESRGAQYCTQNYDPVCGWFSEDIQCVQYPCASTYSNSCSACIDEKVDYWTEGECP